MQALCQLSYSPLRDMPTIPSNGASLKPAQQYFVVSQISGAPIQARHILVYALDLLELSCLIKEDMDDDIAVIQ